MRAVRECGLSAHKPFEIEARTLGKKRLCRVPVSYNPLRMNKDRLPAVRRRVDIEDRKRAEERLQHENVALREEIDSASMFEKLWNVEPLRLSVLFHAK